MELLKVDEMDILIKEIPEDLVAKIDKQAAKNRRSRTQEIITILELGMGKASK